MVGYSKRVEFERGDIVIDARLVDKLLKVEPADVPRLMWQCAITSISERGIEADQGWLRISFFYRNRRVRLSIDPSGQIQMQSTIDFGNHALPASLRGQPRHNGPPVSEKLGNP